MNGTSRTSRPCGGIGAGAAVLGACLVCCAAPVLSVLGGIAALSAVAAVWIPALAVLTVLAGAAGIWIWRRQRAAACASPAAPVDLGMPGRGLPPAVRVGQPSEAPTIDAKE